MDSKAMLDRLWEMTLKSCNFNFEDHSVTLTADLFVGGKEFVRHTITCRGLRSFRLAFLDNEPWDYMELSNISAKQVKLDGEILWELTSELWDSPSELRILCAEFDVSKGAPMGG